MIKEIELKEENKIRKNAETRMAGYIYIVYCHLENKKLNLKSARYNFYLKFVKLNNKSKDRTILRLNINRNIKKKQK